MNIFGFQINYRKKEQPVAAIVTPEKDDGSAVLASSASAYYSQFVDMDISVKNENDLIKRYREVSLQSEVDFAIEEITNEVICSDEEGEIVKLNLDELKVSDQVKKKILAEFDTVKNLLEFDTKAHDLFRNWYIDGRQHHIITIDTEKVSQGIQRIDYVDSRKIRKVKKIEKKKDPKTGIDVIVKVEEFFLYNEKGIDSAATQGIKLSVDSVAYTTSGLYDQNSSMILSYLHKAIKPANQLKMLEDATVIYRISRAPERRIFYIDVGNLPKLKADQYVADIMNRYRNKITYDATTGEVRDDRKYMSMLEDFWMPRREGGKGTEITTLPGGQTLGQMDDVEYFKQKLYQSLNVPISRLMPQQNFTLGRSNEITREELKFHKFVTRLRGKFSTMLLDILKVQLIAKNVIKADDWKDISQFVRLDFTEDNNFVELKENELWMGRFAMLQQVDPYVGRFISSEWVKKNVMKFNEEEIKEIDAQIAASSDAKEVATSQGADVSNAPPQTESQQENVSIIEALSVPEQPVSADEARLARMAKLAEIDLLENLNEYLKKGD